MRSILFALFLITTPLVAQEPVATILGYHEVVPGGLPPFPTHAPPGIPDSAIVADRYTLSLENFAAQIDDLDQHGYNVIALADLVDYLNGDRSDLPPKSVVITVDDGYLSAYQYIFPLMRSRKLPWTLFIYPQIVNVGRNYVTWTQVEEMAKAGVDIESHTYTHPLLTAEHHSDMPADEYASFLKHELLDSKTEIESHTGKPVKFLAYPYSDENRSVELAAQQYGYAAAVADRDSGELIRRGKSQPMRLYRFPVEHDTTLDQFSHFLLPDSLSEKLPPR